MSMIIFFARHPGGIVATQFGQFPIPSVAAALKEVRTIIIIYDILVHVRM